GLHTTMHVDYLDALNQVVEIDRRHARIIHQNDALGREIRLSVQDPALAQQYGTDTVVLVQLKQYDGNDNLTLTVDAQGNKTQFDYDGADRKAHMVEGLGSAVEATTTYTYDKVGDLVSAKDGRPHGGPTHEFPQDPNNPAPSSFDAYYTYDV